VLILLGIQSLFFVTNGLNSLLRDPSDGWELKIGFIDNHLSPSGIWLIPYAVGFFLSALVPLWAAYTMPNKLYRQFVLSLAFALLTGYVVYLALPTYVVKPAPDNIKGSGLFSELLHRLYESDDAMSTHNAAPSQHVFYASLNMCFMIRFRPRPRVFWFWSMLAALITVSALLTRQHHSPDLISGYLWGIAAYYAGLWLGARVTAWLGDEDAPIIPPPVFWKPRRQQERRARKPRQSVDMGTAE
jgi:membrane-associated phospholipid phosphatase